MPFGGRQPQRPRFDPRDDWRDLFLRTRGRIARVTFVWTFALVSLIWLGLGYAIETSAPSDILVPLWWVVTSPFAWMGFALGAKRFQDLGLTRWGALVLMLPGIRWAVALGLAAAPSESAYNPYGWPPESRRRPSLRVLK